VDLRSGLLISTLHRFSSGTLDGAKIEANSGVIVKDGSLWPKGDWRPISEYEAEILGLALKSDGCKFNEDSSETSGILWIFGIPLHLLQHWHRISGQFVAKTGAGSLDEDGQYRRFVSLVVDFFRFKGVPLPNKCKFEIVSNFSEIGPTIGVRAREGSDLSVAAQVPFLLCDQVKVAVNLSAAPSALIFVNLSIAQMESILVEDGDITLVCERSNVEQFFLRFPEYPCFRISLAPRIGYVLGGLSIVHARWSISRTHPDLWLCVTAVPE
jgi:hypothetical protein